MKPLSKKEIFSILDKHSAYAYIYTNTKMLCQYISCIECPYNGIFVCFNDLSADYILYTKLQAWKKLNDD